MLSLQHPAAPPAAFAYDRTTDKLRIDWHDRLTAVDSPHAPPAPAQPATARSERIAEAETLIAQGDGKAARRLLTELAAQPSGVRAEDNEVEFLTGLLDLAEHDYRAAVVHFHRVLVDEPQRLRVRLELGRAYFLQKDYANAQRQFLFARAGRPPAAVEANIDRYLAVIRSLQTFTYTLSFALASDSNLNAGPATDSILLYGLPFQLSPAARSNSGVGLSLDAGSEWSPRLTARLRWRFGGELHRSQYADTAFDDMTLALYSGPHLTLKRWDFNLLGSKARRWYGDRTYLNATGGGFDATWYATPRLGLGGAVALQQVSYPQIAQQNGLSHSYGLNLFYIPTAASIVRVNLLASTQQANVAAFANHARQIGASYTREFRGGLTVSLAPNYSRIGYDAPLAAFGTSRVDHQFTGQATLLDRRIDWHGFTPRLAYTYTQNDSNVPLYAFHRHRIEMGLTRAF